MPDKLDPSSGEIRAMARAAVECMANYYDRLAGRPLLVPTTSRDLRALAPVELSV